MCFPEGKGMLASLVGVGRAGHHREEGYLERAYAPQSGGQGKQGGCGVS